MVSIPTPVPRSVVAWVRTLFSASATMVLWRLLLMAAFALLLLALTALGPGFFVATVVGLVISVVWSDNIRALVLDLWHMRFYSVKV